MDLARAERKATARTWFFSILLVQLPLFSVYVAGLGIALANLRFGRPAVFLLLGCGTLLLTKLAVVIIQRHLVEQREVDWRFTNAEGMVVITATVLQAIGFGLVAAAAHYSFQRIKAAELLVKRNLR